MILQSAVLCLLLLGGIFDWLTGPKRVDPDEAVLVQLKKAGSNLSKPHRIEFFLYFPTKLVAEQAALRIKPAGFEVDVKLAAKGNDWLCFATRTMIPELPALQKIRRDFTAIASSLGGEYDGWGTAVEK